MTSDVVDDRINRLMRVMDAQGWDCVLATSPESVHYFSGALIHTQTLMRRRQCAVLVTRDGKATLIVPEIERHLAARLSGLPHLVTYKVLSESACLAAIGVLGRQGPLPAVVGIEKTHLPVIDFDELAKHLPAVRFAGADEQLVQLRILKSDSEVQTISLAAAAMEDGILAAVSAAKAGTREEEVSAAICQHVQRIGGGKVRSVTGLVASGANLRTPHHMANATKLAIGDAMRIGCRAVFEGYHGIVNRTAFVGDCAPNTLEHYSRLHQAHQQLLALLQPGIEAGQVYEQMAAAYRRMDLHPTNPHFGYGTGLEFQERPKLAPGIADRLQAGMTILAESVSHDAIVGHMYIVDMVLLESGGVRLLSNRRNTAKPLYVSPE